jgi:hypothetical protein
MVVCLSMAFRSAKNFVTMQYISKSSTSKVYVMNLSLEGMILMTHVNEKYNVRLKEEHSTLNKSHENQLHM